MKLYGSPLRLLFLTVLIITITETAVMNLFQLLPPQMPWMLEILLDIFFTVFFVFILTYVAWYYPLERALSERDEALKIVEQDKTELEQRIHDRTLELEQSNENLKSEIIERKRVEEKLRILTHALESAANGVVITDCNGKVLWSNRAFTQMTGYSSGEIEGKTLNFLKSNEQSWSYYQRLWNTILSKQVWQDEIVNRRKDGRHYIEDQTITPIVNDQGEITHFIAIKQDVTARKQAERIIEQRNLELSILNEVGMAVSRTLELSVILQALQDILSKKIGVQAGLIYIITPLEDRLEQQAVWGVERTVFPLHLELSDLPLHVLVSTREQQTALPSWNLPLSTDAPWFNEYDLVPLIGRERLEGLLCLSRLTSAELRRDENTYFFRALGYQVGQAIQNAHLFEAEKRNRRLAETLSSASLALTQTLNLDVVLETLLDYLKKVVPYDSAHVLLLEGEDEMILRGVRGWAGCQEASCLGQVLKVSENLVLQKILDSKKTLWITDPVYPKDWNWCCHETSWQSWLGLPLLAGDRVIGICMLEKVEEGDFHSMHIMLAEVIVNQAVIALQNAWLFDQVRSGQNRFQSLSRRLVEVQESERAYISRELHDESSQALASLLVGMELVKRDLGNQEAAMAGMAELERIINEVLDNLHRMALNLRPATLDHVGLAAGLRQYIKSFSDLHGIIVQFETVDLGDRQDPEVETSIYRIVQEALSNVALHAHATRVDVVLERRDNRMIAIIEDNGIGFDPKSAEESGRLGLFGMRERAEMIAGSLTVESAPGAGTSIYVDVPLKREIHSGGV